MRPRWKRAAALLLAAALCMGLGGCLDHPLHHNRWEVGSYVQKNFPGEKVKISWKHRTEVDDKHELRDTRVWDCYFDDMPSVVFHVRSSWYTDSLFPIAGYRLHNDKDEVFWRYYLDRYLSKGNDLDAWDMEAYRPKMEFSSMEQVYPAAEQLGDFYYWLKRQPHAAKSRSASFQLIDLPLPVFQLDDWSYIDGDMEGDSFRAAVAGRCAAMLMEYYSFYNLPCPGFTADNVSAYAREAWPWDDEYPYPDAVRYQGSLIPKSTFAGIGVKAGYTSYGGFYDILTRLEFPVEGTPERFSFTGLDGCAYEFSYAFSEEVDGEPKWYYTRDGEHLTSGSTSYTHGAPLLYLKDEALPDMVGLTMIHS